MSDLRTEVAEIITGGGCQVERWSEALERAEEIIDLLRPKLAGEWISVKDDMPGIGEYVLLMADRYWSTPEGVPDMKVTAAGYLAEFGGLHWSILTQGAIKNFKIIGVIEVQTMDERGVIHVGCLEKI